MCSTNVVQLDAANFVDGQWYVTVHTNDGVDGTNSGPGDFPGGEIRGQLDHGR